jgi:D-sedoheptulose 7-phosphate isomerase
MLDLIRKRLKESADIKMDLLQCGDLLQTLSRMIDESVRCFREHHRMYFCGNGGSAADAVNRVCWRKETKFQKSSSF